MMITGDELLTVHEISAYLKKSPSWVYRRSRDGKLPARKVGGTWRYSLRAVEEWVQAGQPAPDARPAAADVMVAEIAST